MAVKRIDSYFDVPALQAEHDKFIGFLLADRKALQDLYGTIQSYKGTEIKNITTGTEKLTGATSEVIKMTAQYDDIMRKLNASLTREAELLAQAKVANQEVNKQLKEQARQVLGLDGAYKQLEKEYSAAKRKSDDLGASLGVTSKEFIEAAAATNELNNKLKMIDAGGGKFTRNVGNYMEFNNVLRELPNFAISATTGIQALSNNIPQAAERFSALRKEGKSLSEVFKIMGGTFTSFGGIVTILTIALTALPKILSAMQTSASKATVYFKNVQEAQGKAAIASQRERVELEALLVVAKDKTKSDAERSAAIKSINDIMPDYLGDITQEMVNTGKANKVIGQYILQISKKALAQAYISKIQELYVKEIDLENSSIEESIHWYDNLWNSLKNGGNFMQFNAEVVAKGAVERQKSIVAIKKEREELEKNFHADLESGKAKLDTDKMLKEAKDKKTKRDDAAFQIEKANLEYLAGLYKAIAADEENSLGVRTNAYLKFTLVQQQIILKQSMWEKGEKDISAKEKEKIENDARIKSLQAESEYYKNVHDITKKFREDQKKEREKAAKDKEDKEKDFISAEASKVADRTLRDQQLLNMELYRLNESYLAGEIGSYEEYQKRKEAITEKGSQRALLNETDAIRTILDHLGISYEKRQEYETKLAELRKKLTDEDVSDQKKAEDQKLANQKKYAEANKKIAQELYNLAVALAQSQYTNELNLLAEQRDMRQAYFDKEQKNIAASSLSEQDKAAKSTLLRNQQESEERTYDQRKREIQLRQARFGKALSILNIIATTAQAVIAALAPPPIGLGPIAGIPLAASAGAFGALQIATVLATPLPKFEKGGTARKGTSALTDEKGRELYVEKGTGNMYMGNDYPTLRNFDVDTDIIPADRVNQYLYNKMVRETAARVGGSNGNAEMNVLRETMIWQTHELKKAMGKGKGKTVVHNHINMGRIDYLNKKVYN